MVIRKAKETLNTGVVVMAGVGPSQFRGSSPLAQVGLEVVQSYRENCRRWCHIYGGAKVKEDVGAMLSHEGRCRHYAKLKEDVLIILISRKARGQWFILKEETLTIQTFEGRQCFPTTVPRKALECCTLKRRQSYKCGTK